MSVGESLVARVSSRTKSAGQFLLDRRRAVPVLCTVVSIAAGLAVWQLASLRVPTLFLPSPLETWEGFLELLEDGTLGTSILASGARILVGWGLGVAVGVPLGIFMGYFRWVRRLFDPYIEFFRFIPPIAFVTLAVIWLGPGEASKVALIFYTTVFIVTLNTINTVGFLGFDGASLGAGPLTTLRTVIVPSTVPYMVTGARLAMGNSFLTIVSAEIVAAQEGLGSLIWNARNYSRTEWVFVGIITLGLLGFLFDRILRLAARTLLKRYGVAI